MSGRRVRRPDGGSGISHDTTAMHVRRMSAGGPALLALAACLAVGALGAAGADVPYGTPLQTGGGSPAPIEPGAADLDVNRTAFPAASLVDFSYLLSPPAGKHGFLGLTDDGHFVFEDGTPVRFWGINVAKDSVFQAKSVIDAAVSAIARAGFNLVRLHHLDDVTGLLPPGQVRQGTRIDHQKLDAVDYWISRLRAKGIYVYLDLLAYRTFRQWEGVPGGERLGRGAKPYAVFDDRLIELQQQYAAELLVRHVNPYTGLSYAEDPGVCLVELCDENGLLHQSAVPGELVEPYRSALRARWNAWLRERCEGTPELRRAWGSELGSDESLERGTVRLVAAPEGPDAGPCGAREAAFCEFAVATHRAYFARMRDFLRGHGVRVPITAVGRPGRLADVRAVAAELDFVGTNFYWDHPFYPAGRQWQLPALYRNENEVASTGVETLVPATAVSKVAGKPLVVREWNACWPNKYRSTAILAAAAYGNLQRHDGMILFTFDTRESAKKLSFFDVRRDPARWGLVGLAAKCFLEGDVRPARRTAFVAWSNADTLSQRALPRWRSDAWRLDDIYDVGWACGVSNVFAGHQVLSEAAVLAVPGSFRPAGQPATHAVFFKPADAGRSALSVPELLRGWGYDLTLRGASPQRFAFDGVLYDAGDERHMAATAGFSLQEVKAQGYVPIGRGMAAPICYGFYDPGRCNFVFGRLPWREAVRMTLDALGTAPGESVSHKLSDSGTFISTTGELRRDERSGVFTIDSPFFQAIGGALDAREQLRTSQIALSSQSSIGTFCAASLDGKPLSKSRHYVMKMVSFATNSGERKRLHARQHGRAIYALTDVGEPPVQTLGRAAVKPTSVFLSGRPLFEVFMANGSWELVREQEAFFVFCDTPGMRFFIHELPGRLAITRYGVDGAVRRHETKQPAVYPASTLCLKITHGRAALKTGQAGT